MSSCRHCAGPSLSRREMLLRASNGFGAVALAALFAEQSRATPGAETPGSPRAPRAGHYPAQAKSVIFLYMDGGPSQVDTFDPKPRLTAEHGLPLKMHHPPTQFIPPVTAPQCLGSPWKFSPRCQWGTPVSDLLPHIAESVDDLCVVR